MKYVVFLALVLSGCATPRETYWYKATGSQQSFNQDFGYCRAQAFSVASGNLFQIAMVQNSCMEGRGWELRER